MSAETDPPSRTPAPVKPVRRLSMFGRSIDLPRNRWLRMALGAAFIVGGILAVLPVFGLWMIPVGLAILSVDVPPIRRWSARTAVRLRQRYPEQWAWLHRKLGARDP